MTPKRAALLPALVTLVACLHDPANDRPSGYWGRVLTDGRGLGRHDWSEAFYPAIQRGSHCAVTPTGAVALDLILSAQLHGGAEHGWVVLPTDTQAGFVQVDLPWTHMAIAARQCSVFEIEIHDEPPLERDAGGPTRGGSARLACDMPERADSLALDLQFRRCR